MTTTKKKSLRPDPEDYATIREDPKYFLCSNAEKYNLAVAAKLIRLYGPPKKPNLHLKTN
jgi:hypothetical protein